MNGSNFIENLGEEATPPSPPPQKSPRPKKKNYDIKCIKILLNFKHVTRKILKLKNYQYILKWTLKKKNRQIETMK